MECSFSRRHFHLIMLLVWTSLQLLLLVLPAAGTSTPLTLNFYEKLCPHVGEIVQNITWPHISKKPELAPKFLRMHFHDCFVRGCDGSILLDSTPTNKAEKDSIPNRSLAGYDVIDEIKVRVEEECPGVVSCADILALVARDSVSFQFKMQMWPVPVGRRDGNISRDTEALSDLPSPFSNISTLLRDFASRGLDGHDLVVLSGGHTIGTGHCNLFSNRLYNFTGKGDQDPSLNPSYADTLRTKCKNLQDTSAVEMDPGSSQVFDSDYFVSLKKEMGMFQSDATLLTDESARRTVDKMTDQTIFFKSFALSMVKMGAIQVLTGTSGEIRRNCRLVNS